MATFEPGFDRVRPPPVQLRAAARATGPASQLQQDAALGELDVRHLADGTRSAGEAGAELVRLSCVAAEHGSSLASTNGARKGAGTPLEYGRAPLLATGARTDDRPSP